MLFNSYEFVFLLLPVTLAAWYALCRFRKYAAAKAALVLSSLIFYAWFHLSYLPILVGSILVNFAFGRLLLSGVSHTTKKTAAMIGVLLNLIVLGYFKYFDFFLENVNLLFGTRCALPQIMLPLGVSFFTFQQVSYLVDCYRADAPRYAFLDYALFVSFFPQLVAGPIVLHSEMAPQFAALPQRRFSAETFGRGLTRFAYGLAKKVLLADLLGELVSFGYADVAAISALQAWITMLSYTLQIYFDFSGYCDMACGIAGMFGMTLPENFNSPYKALNVVDFWNRWHMTLTRFFRRYVYFPLGGSRKGAARTYINVFIVFLISGVWHGAGYTFIVWGILHGIANIFCRVFRKPLERMPKAVNWLLCFGFLNASWVVFRADSLSQAAALFRRLFAGGTALSEELIAALRPNLLYDTLQNLSLPQPAVLYCALLLLFALLLATCCRNTQTRVAAWRPNVRTFVTVTALLTVGILSLAGVHTFLYFNF